MAGWGRGWVEGERGDRARLSPGPSTRLLARRPPSFSLVFESGPPSAISSAVGDSVLSRRIPGAASRASLISPSAAAAEARSLSSLARVSRPWFASIRKRPRSATFATPFLSSSTFAGFRSRWAIGMSSAVCKYSIPHARSRIHRSDCSPEYRGRRSWSPSEPPAMNSWISIICPSFFFAVPSERTTFSWRSPTSSAASA